MDQDAIDTLRKDLREGKPFESFQATFIAEAVNNAIRCPEFIAQCGTFGAEVLSELMLAYGKKARALEQVGDLEEPPEAAPVPFGWGVVGGPTP